MCQSSTSSNSAAPLTAFLILPALLSLPLLAVYLPQALVIVLTVVAVARLGECLRFRQWPRWNRTSFALGLAAAGWALISAMWALQPIPALSGAAGLAGLVVAIQFIHDGARALPHAARQRALMAFVAGCAAAGLLLGVDLASHGALAGLLHHYDVGDYHQRDLALRSLNRGASFLGLLSPFVMLAALRQEGRQSRLIAWSVLALVLVVVVLRGKEALGLGLAVAALIGVAGWLLPVVTRRLMAAALVAVVLAAPVAARYVPAPEVMWSQWRHVNESVLHRLVIWRFTAERIADRPLLGWGMNGAKGIPGGSDDVVVGPKSDETRWRRLPLHPHNAVLQWWLELGVVGAGLVTALVLTLMTAAGRLAERDLRAAVLAFGANFLVVSLVSFGAWQSWWLASLAIGVWLTSLARERTD